MLPLDRLEGEELAQGKYRLEHCLGSGGYGSVYEAVQKQLDRKVAIKLLHASGKDVLTRFEREAKLQAKLEAQTPHVVRIYDYGFEDRPGLRAPYIVMEFVQGVTLYDHIFAVQGKVCPMAPEHVAFVLREMLCALEVAHTFKIVHRDIKPANIMLSHDASGQERVRLLDFGVSGVQEEFDSEMDSDVLTQTGDVIGTLRYIAPECLSDGQGYAPQTRLSHVTDLYALGMTAYTMLTGTGPFQERSVASLPVVYHLHREGKVDWLQVHVPGFDGLCAVVNKLMAFVPEQRYQSATQALQDLDLLVPSGAATQLPRIALHIPDMEQTELSPRTPSQVAKARNFESIAPLGDLKISMELQQRLANARAGKGTPTGLVVSSEQAFMPGEQEQTPAHTPRAHERLADRQSAHKQGARVSWLAPALALGIPLLLVVLALLVAQLGKHEQPAQPPVVVQNVAKTASIQQMPATRATQASASPAALVDASKAVHLANAMALMTADTMATSVDKTKNVSASKPTQAVVNKRVEPKKVAEQTAPIAKKEPPEPIKEQPKEAVTAQAKPVAPAPAESAPVEAPKKKKRLPIVPEHFLDY